MYPSTPLCIRLTPFVSFHFPNCLSNTLCVLPPLSVPLQEPLPCCKVEGEADCLLLPIKLEVPIPKQVWSR